MTGVVIDHSAVFERRRLEAELDRVLELIGETQTRTEAGRRRCEELLAAIEADARRQGKGLSRAEYVTRAPGREP